MRKKDSVIFILFLVITLNCSNLMSQQWGLYTLYATKNGTQAFLIDTADSPVTYKTWNFTSTTKNAYSCYLIPGDTLVRTTSYQVSGAPGSGGITGRVQKISWSGAIAWDFSYSSSTTQLHHDICPLPNGNVLMISYDLKTAAEATLAGSSTSAIFWSEKIIEVQPTGATTGNIVWEWKLWDHICQNYSSAKNNYVSTIIDNPQLLNINYAGTGSLPDRFHMNGIDFNPALNQIVVSMHFMNSVFIIDHSTTTAQAATHSGGNSGKGGDFLYRWGNPASYGASGTANFSTVHDAHWVPSDNLNFPNYLCAYNNQGGTSGKTAIDIWNPPYNGYNYSLTAGSSYAPTTYSSRFNTAFTATNEGNSHQLPNGNILVCNFQGSIYEVNAAGTNLWTKTSATSSHAYRYSKCYVRAPIASATASATQVNAGTAVSLGSSATSVTETSPTYTFDWSSTSGFTSTLQNPEVNPTSNTTYMVIVTNTTIGCSDTASVTVNVNGSITLTVNATATPSAICPGSSVQLNCVPTGGNSYSYQWSSNPAGFTSTLQNPVVNPSVNTIYTVSITSDTNVASNSTSVILYTSPATPVISQNGSLLTSSAASGNQWYFNNTLIQGATANTYTPTQTGSFQVEVSDANGCTAMSAVFSPSVGISENTASGQNIGIYPNPAQNILHLSLPVSILEFETQIRDIYGKLLLRNTNSCSIDLSALNNGIYFIEIKVEGKSNQRTKILLNK
ncbi:MAG: aryl-sulfate sulfotransferase [Bacteroidota bacterium]